jgi:hypothetical protein
MSVYETRNRTDWRTLTSPSVPQLVVRNHPLLWKGEMLPIGALFPINDNMRRTKQLYEKSKIGLPVVVKDEVKLEPKKRQRGK